MKTKFTFILLPFISVMSMAQSVTLTLPQIENTYHIRFEDNHKEQIEISITDSKKEMIANKLFVPDDTPISLIISEIFKTISNLSADYHYKIPKSSLVLEIKKDKETMTYANCITELKKLKQKECISLLKSTVTFNIEENKSDYKTFLNSIEKKDDFANVFSDKNLKYYVKKSNDSEYKLFNDSTELGIITSTSEDGFLEILYQSIKNDDAVIKLLVSELTFKSFKEVDFYNMNNTILLEKAYYKLKGNEKVVNYSYLGYIGTNFDLVEGVQAKNVFFAVNILQKPKREKDKVGFYISLYGNRTLSKNDSIKNIARDYRVFDSLIDGQNQKFSQRQIYSRSKTVNIDNLGAYFSPLVKLYKLSNLDGNTQFFFAPSLEFIWRRISIINQVSTLRNEIPFLVPGTNENYISTISQTPSSYNYHAYDFNLGAGFWVFHENKQISVRLNMNIGGIRSFAPNIEDISITHSSNFKTDYKKTSDVFYTGKLWITEATTGVTLQAEILNTLKKPNPFYGVTLSKAFDFEKLGNFFKPITAKE